MGIFSIFGGSKSKVNIDEWLKNGAVVVDVRSEAEFRSGHVKGSKNIPLDSLKKHTDSLKALNKPIITCCKSGMRSAMAIGILEKANIECANGGSWEQVQHRIA